MDEHSVYADLIDQALPVPMQAGSILALDGTVFHAVGVNHSENWRASIALAYHSWDELDETGAYSAKIIVRGEPIYRGNDTPGRHGANL